MEIPGGRGVIKDPLGMVIPKGWGDANQKPSVGGVWIFSGTTHFEMTGDWMQVTWKRLGTRMSSHPCTPPVKPKFYPLPTPSLNFMVHHCPSFARLCESCISSLFNKAIKAHIVQINNKKQMISWLCQQPMMLNIYPRLKRYLQL